MRQFLLIILLLFITSCSIKTKHSDFRIGTDNIIYGEGTIIGLSVGMSGTNIPTKITVGYEKYSFLSKPKNDKTFIDLINRDIIDIIRNTIITEKQIILGEENE